MCKVYTVYQVTAEIVLGSSAYTVDKSLAVARVSFLHKGGRIVLCNYCRSTFNQAIQRGGSQLTDSKPWIVNSISRFMYLF